VRPRASTVTKVTSVISCPVTTSVCALAMSLMFFMPALAGPTREGQAAPVAHDALTAEALYVQLGNVGLDPSRVYLVRDASLDREDLHISLDDGRIAFTRNVLGRVTGAFFEGEGEILLVPPDQAERSSMALFTGSAILEEKFTSAYLRFNDDTFEQLQPALRAASDAQDYVGRLDAAARNLAGTDALRLLLTFSRSLPSPDGVGSQVAVTAGDEDRFLHARLQNQRRGLFDVYFDSTLAEQISVGQLNRREGASYYDMWTSFATRSSRLLPNRTEASGRKFHREDKVEISRYEIHANVTPPENLTAETTLDLQVRRGGDRTLLFELSRFLEVQAVESDGKPVEFIHNPSVEGTQRARRSNDVVAVIFPQLLQSGQRLRLRFKYSGSVLSDAGGGLLYVGARGTWYPNRGMANAQFEMEFRYPVGWTLLATGKLMSRPGTPKPSSSNTAGSEQVSHWQTERPIPLAGFNMGRYVRAVARAGKVEVQTYAAGVEHAFPRPHTTVTPSLSPEGAIPAPPFEHPPDLVPPQVPSPARNAQSVAEKSARAIDYWSSRLGPFPYSSLALTQIPGPSSQGWPGLVYLSSYTFLQPEDRANLRLSPTADVLYGRLMQWHETAHQWWGDLVMWRSYRDQWISEALANYCALMMVENDSPQQFAAVMDHYRQQLLANNKEGMPLKDAGPVTLGIRLSSSRFPTAYDEVAYGRGTWLFHMLRHMLRDAAGPSVARLPARSNAAGGDELFWQVLRRLQERYAGKEMTLSDVQEAFEEQLPAVLRYENRKSLDWFFQGWVNGTAIPRLRIRDMKFVPRGATAEVTGTILQEDAPDDLVTSVPIYAVTGTRSQLLLGRVFAEGHETHFRLTAPIGAHKLIMDPYQSVLAQVR